jgi:hypothetical protein
MKAILIAAAMMLAACGGEEEPEGLEEKAAAVSRVVGGDVVCDGPTARGDFPESGPPFTAVICRWDCLRIADRAVRYFYVHYLRETAEAPWTGPAISVDSSQIEMCAAFSD